MKADIPFSRDLVLVGGGHTHALVLKMWAMNPLPGARLTLINPGPLAPYSGMLPGFIAGHYDRDDLYIDLMRLARAAGARLVLGKAHAIDRQRQLVHVRGRPPIGYDLCSIDIGITSSMPDLSGFAEHGVPAKPLDGFAARWEQFCSAPGQGDVAVLGAGVAGAEIAMAAAHRMGKLGREARVHLIDRSGALSRLSRRSRDRVIAALRGLGVVLREHAPVQQVTETSVVLASGEVIDAQITLGAAGTRAHGWLGDLGLPITNGFLDVTPSLQSPEDPAIFAAGDCAHLHHAPRPKAGVFAVREAPVLAHNLRAALMGAPLRSYHPQKDYLKLISLGGKAALAEKSGVAFSGALMWRWKDQIDRKFMRQFGDLEPMQAAPPEERAAGASQEADMLCAGCGSKVGRGVLSGVLEDAPGARADIVPLPGDDAALIRLGEARQVISTDHLRAFTDDPVVMTRIAAVHALGDIWSMGAEPQAALISLILPRMEADLQERSLAEVMAAARQVMGDAGADIIGGHTTMGAEFTLGFTVTGLVGDAPITLGGAQPGDRLILTKPIGTGVLLAAEMQMRASGAHVAAALATMQRPLAKDAGILADAHAMTDVTGFGLAGHLANICRASGVSARLNVDAVPLLAGALELSAAGVQSSLYADNLSDALTMMQAPTTERGRLMLDPQTAGGLLAA
ncbi:MAG: selenide, water dikinase SelD, partial [Pseudomonadota bacterium]